MIQKAEPSMRTAQKLEALGLRPIRSAAEPIGLLVDTVVLEQLILAGRWGEVDALVDEMERRMGEGR